MNVVITSNEDGSLDLICKQGKTLTWTWQLFEDELKTTPMNLVGYSARGQVRKKYSSSDPSGIWTCTIPTPGDGTVHMLMSAATSAAIPAGESIIDLKSQYVYDIELYTGISPEVVVESIGGKYFNDPEATK